MSALLSVAPVTATSNVPSGDLTVADRIIEIVAVILLGLSTVGTAWCAYQAAQWSAASSELARQSSDQQVESARLFGLATQEVAYDSTIVAQYAEAAANGNTRLVRFYRTSLVRPEFLPILDRWEADIRAGQAPTPLTDDPDYVAKQLADYQKSVAASDQFARESQEAGDNASAYVSVTILLAVTLFFAGVTTQFKYRPARALLLAAALATLALAASQLADLPVMFG
jgi:hypothetical protein